MAMVSRRHVGITMGRCARIERGGLFFMRIRRRARRPTAGKPAVPVGAHIVRPCVPAKFAGEQCSPLQKQRGNPVGARIARPYPHAHPGDALYRIAADGHRPPLQKQRGNPVGAHIAHPHSHAHPRDALYRITADGHRPPLQKQRGNPVGARIARPHSHAHPGDALYRITADGQWPPLQGYPP